MATLQDVELGVLGPLQVRQDGAPVAIPGAKPRALLTMLGLHGGSVVSADALMELLWGKHPPRTAAKALQTHISSLRRSLGDGFVLTEGAGWTLASTEVDASRYRRAARLGRDAAATGDTAQAVVRFEEALTLWRGVPELPDGPRGASEKTRWIEAHAALVEDRADALLATGRAAEIVGELEAAVADAPLRERRWGQLMLALYRAGRQGEALGAYQRARALLAEELGVDPGPELRRLEAAIVAQDASLEIAVAQNPPSVTRAVTFLLTDIEGSTAAWEADADAMAVALARHDELVEQVVTSHGGRLIKTRGEGDATFSVFDRPSAAAAAAVELQDAIDHEPWGLREPVLVRIALHTGEVEFRDGDYFGRAVNRAARLRSLAEGGQILCSGATAELVIDSLHDDVVLADLGMRQLRNLTRPEHIFELRPETAEERRRPEPDEVMVRRPSLPAVLAGPGPFVGRGSELERLFAAWQTALTGGTNAVLIAGEPGVGKTRLAGEWSQQAYDQGALVIYGRCDEDLGAPYQPFAEALRGLVPCLSAASLRRVRGAEALLALTPGLTEVLPDLSALTRADPDTERYALFDAVVALLGVASGSAPVVLILDDLHWAAKPTLLLLRHLLRFGERARVQVIGTYRSTDLDRSHPLAAMLADLHRDGTAHRLALGGLEEDDVTAYVAGAGYDDEELARALASVTGGNPFFLIEALRHVDESGGHWDPSTLPQGVREAVSRRLSRLPVETNRALAAAAVVGSRFAVDLVERVLDQDLVDAFDEASKAGIVLEEPGGRYRFNHAIVRQSLLAELASVRRMRLHQRIAATLESRHGAEDELLAELAHHYFECAWAGNAVKAVEYCRRAADQAMARLAYEGAAELYVRALHALEEIDDELPDRDDQAATLLVARCEALLAAGDVVSAAGAMRQLQCATTDSAHLTAWATCFDGQLSMLVHPGRLDEVEVALRAAAEQLAGLDDAAGEAKAHTVRAGCLARLGRISDCEVALDEALAAARRAHEHRRVNAVLAGAPLAALWGPNPVPRAGGRCLDVVRLLRITTDSPAVEAVSTRCQAVLEALRGRAAAARRMIDSARRTVTELGLRHAVLEVEQFAGIVELVVDDPAAAEPHLRLACEGFRRMGLDADTAETAALLGRACLALGRDAEADELCAESERLAGHSLKPSIAWRSLRAQLSSRDGAHDEARRIAEAAVDLAERTDLLVDHGDACQALATVLDAAGDCAGARAATQRAVGLYERKGAAALADMAGAARDEGRIALHMAFELEDLDAAVAEYARHQEPQAARLENAGSRVARRFLTDFAAGDWDTMSQKLAEDFLNDDRRKVVGSGVRKGRGPQVENMRAIADLFSPAVEPTVVAIRGQQLFLVRLQFQGPDRTAAEFVAEVLAIGEINVAGQITTFISFDRDDFDAAIAELDARYLAGEAAQHSAAWQVVTRSYAALNRHELPPRTPNAASIDHRHGTAYAAGELEEYVRAGWDLEHTIKTYIEAVHRLSDIGAVCTHAAQGVSRDGFDAEWRGVNILMVDGELVGRSELFDEADLDAAIARFDQLSRRTPRLENAASRAHQCLQAHFGDRDWDAIPELVADDIRTEDRRRAVNSGVRRGREALLAEVSATARIGVKGLTSRVIATRGDRLALSRTQTWGRDRGPEAFHTDVLDIVEVDSRDRIVGRIVFDVNDIQAAFAELDARYLAGEAATHAGVWSVISNAYDALNRRERLPTTRDWVNIDHRRQGARLSAARPPALLASWQPAPETHSSVEAVHRLNRHGTVVSSVTHQTSQEGVETEWRNIAILTVEGTLISRVELFDESDLDAALARFEQPNRPKRQLENAASRAGQCFLAEFADGGWSAVAYVLADNFSSDDRRRVVSTGVQDGRSTQTTGMRAIVASAVVAIRGERLALTRGCWSDRGQDAEALAGDALCVVEIDPEGKIVTVVFYDLDEFACALRELDARYVTNEAGDHAHTWSVIAQAYGALNSGTMPATAADLVDIDHRSVAAVGHGDLLAYLQAALNDSVTNSVYAERICRLTESGAVVTHGSIGTSRDGFDAEWRMAVVFMVDGDAISRCEMFDDTDLDAALARFEELNVS